MTSIPARLVFVGEAVLDVTTWLPELPERGGDRLATASAMTAGGGFNVMAAAARQGVRVLFTGRHGTGPAGDLVREALRAEGIDVLRPADPAADTGFVVVMVEPDGERTFVTSSAVLSDLDAPALAALPVGPGDLVYVSGYGLVSAHGAALASWVGSLDVGVTVVADPGPLAGDLAAHPQPRRLLDQLRARADWWSCNHREATAITAQDDPVAAARSLAAGGAAGAKPAGSDGAGAGGRRSGGVVVRTGAQGCVLARRANDAPGGGLLVDLVPAPAVDAIDTTGAGDAHVGVFISGLACGLDALTAAQRATVAAAISTTRRGPATAPRRAELDRFLAVGG